MATFQVNIFASKEKKCVHLNVKNVFKKSFSTFEGKKNVRKII